MSNNLVKFDRRNARRNKEARHGFEIAAYDARAESGQGKSRADTSTKGGRNNWTNS